MVASKHEGEIAGFDGANDEVGDPPTGLLDLRQETHPLISDGAGLRDGDTDVAPVFAAPSKPLDPGVQSRVTDRRGTHVDAPAA